MTVAFGCGAGAYFALLREPQAWVGLLGVAVAVALILGASRWSRVRPLTALLDLLTCRLGGFSRAKLRTEDAEAPVAGVDTHPQRLQGWVIDRPGQVGPRLLIAPARIGVWAQDLRGRRPWTWAPDPRFAP
jgi:competence protein ComEC